MYVFMCESIYVPRHTCGGQRTNLQEFIHSLHEFQGSLGLVAGSLPVRLPKFYEHFELY